MGEQIGPRLLKSIPQRRSWKISWPLSPPEVIYAEGDLLFCSCAEDIFFLEGWHMGGTRRETPVWPEELDFGLDGRGDGAEAD